MKHIKEKKVKKRVLDYNMRDNNFLKVIKTFLFGTVMGFADIIPGISGATIALILSIYEQLIASFDFVFSHFFQHFSKHIFNPKFNRYFLFLLNLYLGVGIGMYIFSKMILNFLVNFESISYSFFVGLIVASIFLLYHKYRSYFTKSNIIFLIFGLIFGWFVISSKLALVHTAFSLFISGFLAISAMLLPGISGSYVLLMLNQYKFVLDALNNRNPIIIYFLFGILLGIIVMAKIITFLLKNYHAKTMLFLFGLMIAGLFTPLRHVVFSASSLLSFSVGFAILFILYRLSLK